jgi:MYXO-CTERM domain-containing protein
VVPLLYHDLVGLDAASGLELWRYAGTPSPVRTTHYRGADEAGFESSPVITGDIVWAADTGGQLSAIDLHTGEPLWRTSLGTPVLGGLAVSGDWLVVGSYDGAVRGFTTSPAAPVAPEPMVCASDATGGGCCQTGDATGSGAAALGVMLAAVVARRRRRA